MSRRKSSPELDIGSDSFMDVIANMVGILIILIVLAGLRVKDLPTTALLTESAPPQPSTESPILPRLVEEPADDVAVAEIPRIAPPTVSQVSDVAEEKSKRLAERSLELKNHLLSLKDELSRMDRDVISLRRDFLTSKDRFSNLEQRKLQLRGELQQTIISLRQNQQRQQTARQDLDQIKGDYLNLQAQLTAAQRANPPAQKIEHSLSAISHEVHGEEWHFRIAGNQVAYVPLKELLENVQSEIKSRKELLIKFPRYQGEVGPIDGFTLQYTIERQSLSIVDELRYGQGIMRIGLTEWRIDPEPDFVGETLEQTLKSRSRFQKQLKRIPSGSTLTFWVYPDGFDSFRMLQAQAREQGFIVAGRPLPIGVPISGSPQGTRSAGQ
ncbi:MAG: hypothetical protein ACKVT0_20850 [Planctomycetaceae bacterium]